MQIVGKSFTPAQFQVYCAGIDFSNTFAEFCVRHNTSAPTLAQRPLGLTPQSILNLQSYYEGLGWHAGPHLFIDDQVAGIHVFSPLTAPGVHTPSWNTRSFGIEQLGEFGSEDYNHGRGLAVQKNAIAAFAILSHAAGIDSHSMRDHLEDPATTHRDCPGSTCHSGKAAFMDAVHDYILGL